MNGLVLRSNIIILIVITLLGLFFYVFRLKETQVFTNDTARDTLKALQIWQNKELTLIGPPASFSINTIREVYFGSLYLYIGILGLIAANWDPLGVVYPNTVLFTLSIPLFYKFISSQTRDQFKIFFAVLLYTLSPITVIHSRFFWNPNLIIPFSVLFWYLITKKTEAKIVYSFLAGIIAGVIFNLHYITVLPIGIYLLILTFTEQRIKGLLALFGLVIASLPILVFEVRNHFYLTQSFWFNIFNQKSVIQINKIPLLERLSNIFGALLGLKPAEIDYPVFFNPNQVWLTIILLITIGIAILNFRAIKKVNTHYLAVLIISLLATIYFSYTQDLLIRYIFAVYPLLILLIVTIFYMPNFKYLSLIIFIPTIYASVGILFDYPRFDKNYLSLGVIEQICKKIVLDMPTGRYNITENIRGDARAMAFRYCLMRDTKIKPQNELTYINLSTLYAISPSLEKIYKEKRWEFSASEPWRLVKTDNFGSVNLYKFVK